MSGKSIIDQTKDAAGNAGMTFIPCLRCCMLCVHPSFLICFVHAIGKKLSQGAKSVTGATAGKVKPCAAVLRWKWPDDDESLVLQKLFLDFLPGKVCVITGGGRGVGQAIAEKYASLGFTLILTARSRDQLEEV